MQLQIRTDGYLDYLYSVYHSSLSKKTKKMLYEMLSDFEKEFTNNQS